MLPIRAFAPKAVDGVMAWKGRLDILVNNAAYQQHRNDFEAISLEQWDHTFKTNLYGRFNMVRAALEYELNNFRIFMYSKELPYNSNQVEAHQRRSTLFL
jgi:NAD(P)-dependent dehydrogenase (short-subunit alcohol dehydrogenase family)